MKAYTAAQLANATLALLNKSEVKMDDESLDVATQIRGFLKAIAAGKLVITAAPIADGHGGTQAGALKSGEN